ncbi:MAG TPA: ATP-binding protein [Sorangium sp.]|nr:ATP-binding protein [Sorangium sp.]
MRRWFNTAGPCNPADHYMLPPEERLPGVRDLIDRKSYFVLHAPRQIGKTTSLLTLAEALTREGRYLAILVSMEVGAPFPDDPGAAELAVLAEWRRTATWQLPAELGPPPFPDAPPGQRIGAALGAWAQAASRPLVVFIDEIDALRDTTLVSVLRQLRSGYPGRPRGFPHALALIGLRDVRDYKVAAGGGDRLGTSSPFNIKVESLTLRNFTRDEVAALYAQHTSDTGQVFQPDAVDRAVELTRGQPWLVNALARQLVDVLVKDRAQTITIADVDRAKEILIERQDTHLDSLVERLREPRIRAVIEPMLAGSTLPDVPPDDLRFAVDLGLVRMTSQGGLDIANPIYREIIVRELAFPIRASLPQIKATWLTEDGRLDADRLLDAFLSFWRQHGETLLGVAPYHEIAPHLVLMAFLHRVVNGGGTVDREYAIGRGRMDLCVRHAGATLAIELKVWRDGRPDPLAEGLAQLDEYLAGLGLQRGWLILFDQRSGQPPIAERTRREHALTPAGREVAVIRA